MADERKLRTQSEVSFARYLDEFGYEWDYEPQIPEKNKRPDFRVRRHGVECLLDAKERAPKSPPPEARFIDPIKGVRKLIESGCDTFSEFGEFLCAVVLQNTGDCQTCLNPWSIFGAMLGYPGITAEFDAEAGIVDIESARNVFLERGGKMISHYVPLEPRESTKNISAIVIPSLYSVPNPAFDRVVKDEIEQRERDLGRILSAEERAAIRWDAGQSDSPILKKVSRVVVCTNPFARYPLPDNIFDDPYDERWALNDDVLERVFAGSQLANVKADPFRQ